MKVAEAISVWLWQETLINDASIELAKSSYAQLSSEPYQLSAESVKKVLNADLSQRDKKGGGNCKNVYITSILVAIKHDLKLTDRKRFK